jgi:hypothetical protein
MLGLTLQKFKEICRQSRENASRRDHIMPTSHQHAASRAHHLKVHGTAEDLRIFTHVLCDKKFAKSAAAALILFLQGTGIRVAAADGIS